MLSNSAANVTDAAHQSTTVSPPDRQTTFYKSLPTQKSFRLFTCSYCWYQQQTAKCCLCIHSLAVNSPTVWMLNSDHYMKRLSYKTFIVYSGSISWCSYIKVNSNSIIRHKNFNIIHYKKTWTNTIIQKLAETTQQQTRPPATQTKNRLTLLHAWVLHMPAATKNRNERCSSIQAWHLEVPTLSKQDCPQTLVKVLNSLCHWLLRKVTPDFLQ